MGRSGEEEDLVAVGLGGRGKVLNKANRVEGLTKSSLWADHPLELRLGAANNNAELAVLCELEFHGIALSVRAETEKAEGDVGGVALLDEVEILGHRWCRVQLKLEESGALVAGQDMPEGELLANVGWQDTEGLLSGASVAGGDKVVLVGAGAVNGLDGHIEGRAHAPGDWHRRGSAGEKGSGKGDDGKHFDDCASSSA